MKRVLITDIVVVVAVAVLVTATLLPAIARMRRPVAEARCQSNLRRWAQAMALYCSDNNSRYPTNRNRSGGGVGNITPAAALSSDTPPFGQTEPVRQRYSINWVEALYSYLEYFASRTDQDWHTYRRCPNASTSVWPTPNPATGYPYPCVTYVMNCNLVEYYPALTRNPRKVMLLREFWQTTIAELRPTNNSTGNSSIRPGYPFLNRDLRTLPPGYDESVYRLHSDGSCVAFADGHVCYFSLDYYPRYPDITATNSWDSETQQWWNFAPGSGKSAPYLKSIAITP